MLCFRCKLNEATVYLACFVDGKMQKVNLCEDCSKQQGVSDPAVSLAEILVCPKCGFTAADFKNSGRLGCPECYTVFANTITPLLTSLHHGPRHVGKTPHAKHSACDQAERIKSLQQQMNKCIENEDFERAAAIRDDLHRIAAKPSSPAT